MLKIRIIPSLLYNGSNLVKGKQFNSWRTVGSVFQNIKLYSLRGVDEIIFLDIVAYKNKKIDFNLIDDFADECFMPLTVGGGIKSIEDIEETLRRGADKVSINSAALENYQLINDAVKYFGSQCIILSVDYKKDKNGNKKIFLNAEKKLTKIDLFEYVEKIEKNKPGEILLTSIDKDGLASGMDLELIKCVTDSVTIPVIASGGVGNLEDIYLAFKNSNADAVALAHVLHYGELKVDSIRSYLNNKDIQIRKLD